MSPDDLPEPRRRYVKMMLHLAGYQAKTDSEARSRTTIENHLANILEVAADHIGHERKFYGALQRYARALAARLRGIEPEDPWGCDFDGMMHAQYGEIAAAAMFCLGELVLAGETIDKHVAALAEAQGSDGSFLAQTAEDQRESLWYHELVLLHGLTSVAMHSQHREALTLVDRSAQFHHAETQPDHATSQPLAMHAFLQDPAMLPTADLLIHAAMTAGAGKVDAVSELLLLDAAVALLLPE